MRSIPLVMVWDMFRHGSFYLLSGFAGSFAMPVLLFTALQQHGPLDPTEPSYITIHITMSQINIFIFAAMAMSAQRAPTRTARFYTLPVTTATLVTWHILPSVVLVSVQVLINTLVLNWMFGLGWPIWGPTLFAAAVMVAIHAGICQTESPLWLATGLAVVLAVVGCWLKLRYGDLTNLPTHYWREVTPGEIVTLILFGALGFYAAIMGVARNRRGDVLPTFDFAGWFQRVWPSYAEQDCPFRSPLAAQAWFNWRSRGFAMPASVIFLLLLGAGVWSISIQGPRELVQACLGAGGMLSVLALVGGLILGNFGSSDTSFDLGHFLATRPISSPMLARSILMTAAKAICVSWSIWAVSFLAVSLLLVTIGFEYHIPPAIRWWYLPATILGPWIVMTTVATLGLTGRAPVYIACLASFFFLMVVGNGIASFFMSPEAMKFWGQCFAVSLGICFLLGTVWAHFSARRLKLVQTPTLIACAITWILLSLLVLLDRSVQNSTSWLFSLFVIGVMSLAVAPFATAPLAINWNRHR